MMSVRMQGRVAASQAVENIGDTSDVQLAINWLLDHGFMAVSPYGARRA